MSSINIPSMDTDSISAFDKLLQNIRDNMLTERDKGTDFENISLTFFRHEPRYQQAYEAVLTFKDWSNEYGYERAQDVGIDLVAVPKGTSSQQRDEQRFHAIQCKCYASDHKVQKGDIDSFFTASGKTYFNQRFIVTANEEWTENATNAIKDQQIPVQVVTLKELRESKIDWEAFYKSKGKTVAMQPKKSLRAHQIAAVEAVCGKLQGDEIEQEENGVRQAYLEYLKTQQTIQQDLLQPKLEVQLTTSNQLFTPPHLHVASLLWHVGRAKHLPA